MEDYQPSENLLQDRVIVVTGASGGIGRIAAETFARYGATVIMLGRNIASLEAVYENIASRGYTTPDIYPFNLATATPQDYETLACQIEKTYGRLDGVLHNAAIVGNSASIEYYDIRQWYNTLQINLHAPFMLTRALMPLLKESHDASIIFTEDFMENTPERMTDDRYALWSAYCVSKAGVRALRQILAEEAAVYHKLRVNSIYPGKINTGLRARAFPIDDHSELLLPDQIMAGYLYLMGPDSATISGHCLQIQQQHDQATFTILPSVTM